MINNIVEENPNEGAADDKVRKQARQLAYDVRYKVKAQFKGGQKADPASLKRAYISQLGKSPAPGPVKQLAKKMLIGEAYDFVDLDSSFNKTISNVFNKVFVEGIKEEEPEILEEDGKYKIRVTDKKSGKSYVRMADRAKIAELRKNPNIASVEMTGYGSPYDKADGKGSSKKKAKKDFDGDGKVESPKAEYKGSKDKAIKKAIATESVGSAIDKGLGAVGDTAKVAGKAAVGSVKVASKVVKGAAKTAGRVAGTAVGAVKAVKKGYKSGADANESYEVDESVGSAIDKGLGAVGDTAKVAGKAAVGGVKVASKVVKGTAKTAGRVAGTAVGAVKAVKKGFKSGADANEEVKIALAKGGFQLDEADIADIIARLEKKRISKGGDPDKSPLGKKTGQAMKAKQDAARNKAGVKTEEVELDPFVSQSLQALAHAVKKK